MTARSPALALCALVLAACASRSPSGLAGRLPEGPIVLVKECRIPCWEPWYARFAVHTWIDYRSEDGRWTRLGIPGTSSDVVRRDLEPGEALADERWERSVRVIDVVTGSAAAAAMQRLARAEHVWEDGGYRAFPGPNSNTFIERVARATPGLAPQLSPNAVGRDHAELRVGVTGSATGLELETPLLGAEVGLREGAQLHLAQLPIGVRLWPPAILLPFLPAIGPRFAP